MEPQFDDDLRQLKNALRQETFRFILIGRNRYSIYKDISNWLRTTFSERPFLELRLESKDYRQINDELVAFKRGIVLIPDFGWLFQEKNESICVAFNQRRDAFARLDIALICFIEPGEFIELPKKVPDWWSLRSLELDFYRETSDATDDFSNAEFEISSLGGQTKEEKQAEIQRLLRQINEVDPVNKLLLQSLYSQTGILYFELASFELAKKYLEQSLSLSQQIGDLLVEGAALNNIGRIYQSIGNYTLALEYFQRSLQISQRNGYKIREGNALFGIGQIYSAQGNNGLALNYFQQSLTISQQAGDIAGEAKIMNNISQIYKDQGNYPKALEYLEKALPLSQQVADKQSEGSILNTIGTIYSTQGDVNRALTYLEQSLVIREQIGDRAGESATLYNMTVAYANQGNDFKALQYAERALRIDQQIGNQRGESYNLDSIGHLYFYTRDYSKALDAYKRSLTIRQQIGYKSGEGLMLNNIGEVYYAKGDYKEALAYFTESIAIGQQINDDYCIAMAVTNIGILNFEQFQDVVKAIPLLFQAATIFEHIGSPNINKPNHYLNTIRTQIGTELFNQIVQDIQNTSQSGSIS